jgi:hypothetical protein
MTNLKDITIAGEYLYAAICVGNQLNSGLQELLPIKNIDSDNTVADMDASINLSSSEFEFRGVTFISDSEWIEPGD